LGDADAGIQPLRDNDTSIEPDPTLDPAQAEWDRTAAIDEGISPDDLHEGTRTGDDQIPATDLPGWEVQPETQGTDPVEAELGDEGQGDLAPEDL
jgi:hypothetical protein